MANYAKKKLRRHFDKMNVDRHIKFPVLILSSFLLSKTDICLQRFFHKICTIFEFCDFKNRDCLTFLVAARQPYVTAVFFWVLYARKITVLSDFIIAASNFWQKRNNYFRKSCVSFAVKYINVYHLIVECIYAHTNQCY